MDARRSLPAVHEVLTHLDAYPRRLAEVAVRDVLDHHRRRIQSGEERQAPDAAALAEEAVRTALRWAGPTLTRVINATGVLIHTNLGRAPLGPEVTAAVLEAAGYCDLEYDLDEGRRSTRQNHVELLLRAHTGAEAALVVNNNAAAVLLMLMALAAPREVVISRGELVEIGGSFRVPDVMALSGARLREVGTTNKTRFSDYERAVGEETAALLKVHRSNFAMTGFVQDVPLKELRRLADERHIWLLSDAGSGALFPIGDSLSLAEEVAAGADVVSASGDKLLGAGQAGVLVGRRVAVERMKQHPLYRAVRPDKLTLAALKATLYHALVAPERIRLWDALRRSPEELAARAEAVRAGLAAAGVPAEIRSHDAVAGGGSLPGEAFPTPALFLPLGPRDAGRLQALLRTARPPVVAAVVEGFVVLNPRTVAPEEVTALVEAVATAWRRLSAGGAGSREKSG